MIPALALAMAVQSEPAPLLEKIPGTLVTFRMVPIPGGKVNIGGKEVQVKPFYMGATEVTWDAYDVFAFRLDMTAAEQASGFETKTRPSKPYGSPDRGFGHKGFPALGIHQNAAQKYVEWLSKKTGKKYRLPTEAEWEHAAKANGSPTPPLKEYAWYWDTTEETTQAVSTKKPNAWGLFDLLGNVCEWVVASDGTPVTKGGHFLSKEKDLTPSFREPYNPKWQESDAQRPKSVWWLSNGEVVGMRVVLDPS
jgi:formylglycine-generating enzyme required for sulfatase activity